MVSKTFFTILLFFISLQPCLGLEITFLQRAAVSDGSITLGDVVNFDMSNDLSKALGTQIISKAPKPGESVTFQSINVKNHILRNFQIPSATRWTGSPSVIVERTGQEITADFLMQIIDNYLKSKQKILPKADIHFIAKTLPVPFIIPVGEISTEIVPSSPAIIGSSSISIIIRVDDRVRKNLSIKGKIKALTSIAVASSPLKRGTILTPSNTHLVIKDITEHRNPCLNLREILGKKLKRSLRAGVAINQSDVEFPPLIKKGQLVKILINLRSLHISATGIARMDGKLNQMIRVRNTSSNKLVFCRVAAPGVVEVQI